MDYSWSETWNSDPNYPENFGEVCADGVSTDPAHPCLPYFFSDFLNLVDTTVDVLQELQRTLIYVYTLSDEINP